VEAVRRREEGFGSSDPCGTLKTGSARGRRCAPRSVDEVIPGTAANCRPFGAGFVLSELEHDDRLLGRASEGDVFSPRLLSIERYRVGSATWRVWRSPPP
jgi:hypothetical protein